jgi:hypothetical protein
MLALLRPWHYLQKLKPHDKTWEAEFVFFTSSTNQCNQDVLAGAQYYHDSKASAENEREKDTDISEEETYTNSQSMHKMEVSAQICIENSDNKKVS